MKTKGIRFGCWKNNTDHFIRFSLASRANKSSWFDSKPTAQQFSRRNSELRKDF